MSERLSAGQSATASKSATAGQSATAGPAEPPGPADGARPAVTARLSVPGPAQMRQVGVRLAGLLRPADLVVLAGTLGAGKTTLVQGIGDGLGVRGPVTSPTFVIARVHPSLRGGPDLVHADAYRLGSRLEVDDLDLDADLDHSVTVVEWGEGLVEGLATGHLRITIDRPAAEGASVTAAGPADGSDDGTQDQPRTVTVAGFGSRWAAAAGRLRAVLAEPLR
jgi:tRNA threonylcarbamoyladenosine biosynthesis protein TsaE